MDARGLGFHRYASKADWSEPHYEKMLYDQAMLALAYLEAYQARASPSTEDGARRLHVRAARPARANGGAFFFSAQDADERYSSPKSVRNSSLQRATQKILSDWNGLMIAALSYGAVVFDERNRGGGKAPRKWSCAAPAFSSTTTPFSFWGLLNLYEATFDMRWLQSAITIEGETIARFRDDTGRFYVTASDAEALLVRPHESGDGAIPSGNSVQLMNLIRLGRITADAKYDRYANDLLRTVADEVSLAPSTATHLLSGLTFALDHRSRSSCPATTSTPCSEQSSRPSPPTKSSSTARLANHRLSWPLLPTRRNSWPSRAKPRLCLHKLHVQTAHDGREEGAGTIGRKAASSE